MPALDAGIFFAAMAVSSTAMMRRGRVVKKLNPTGNR
jgi:hypothetical protein